MTTDFLDYLVNPRDLWSFIKTNEQTTFTIIYPAVISFEC